MNELDDWKEKYNKAKMTPIKSLLTFDSLLSKGEHQGFTWVVLHNNNGYRCGYVRIPETHPWFKKYYDDLNDVSVHGGLTYNQLAEDGWWIGFDCAHLYDLQDPSLPMQVSMREYADPMSFIRSQQYVEQECLSLCEQASEAK